MVSPELLRRFPELGFLTGAQYKAVAMIADEVYLKADTLIFTEKEPTRDLYLLIEGCVDMVFFVEDEATGKPKKETVVGEINFGEFFGVSTLVEPYHNIVTTRSSCECRLLKIDGAGLRALCALDPGLATGFMSLAAKMALMRLESTLVQLAAAQLD